jgi:tRNA 2-thiouridine synthesizing protein A
MTEAPTHRRLDLRGLKCPLPVLRARKALREAAIGDLIVVECTDPLAVIDIPNMVRETGDSLERQRSEPAFSAFHIRKVGP